MDTDEKQKNKQGTLYHLRRPACLGMGRCQVDRGRSPALQLCTRLPFVLATNEFSLSRPDERTLYEGSSVCSTSLITFSNNSDDASEAQGDRPGH